MHRAIVLTSLLVSGFAAAQQPPADAGAGGPSTAAAPSAEGRSFAAAATSRETADGGGADARAAAEDGAQPSAAAAPAGPGGVKTLSGMSVLGNEEAPKSLVIVPWKSSQLGDGLGVTNSIDERARPVDREVFMREVHYYELRAGDQG
ncbi:MAG: hypothetical protein JXB36_15535 [Gammaproteobacteria bacterium]|nr:hypothetical protein [Gammaproteobacteria bacterium]